jgi:hypothetical protein
VKGYERSGASDTKDPFPSSFSEKEEEFIRDYVQSQNSSDYQSTDDTNCSSAGPKEDELDTTISKHSASREDLSASVNSSGQWYYCEVNGTGQPILYFA